MSEFYALSPDDQATRLADLARAACRSWDLGGEPEVRLLKFRENAVFRLDLAGERFAMRVHRAGYHSPAALHSELRWMGELAQAGISTPSVVPTRAGRLYEQVSVAGVPEVRLVDVLSWVDGEPLGSVEDGVAAGADVSVTFREIGRLMALLHHHAQDWERPADFERHSWDVAGLVGDDPLWGRFWQLEALDAGQRALVLAARDKARADLEAFGYGADRYGLIHADFLPENLLVGNDGAIRLIDFDDAGFGWHLFDLATSLFVVAGEPDFSTIRDAFVAGYRTERDLTDEHLAELPLFFLLRGLTYLGWLHTRKETETARELTPSMVAAVCDLATDYLVTGAVHA